MTNVSLCSTVPFSGVAKVITGTTPSKTCPDYYGGNTPFVTPVELEGDDPITFAATTLSAAGSERAKLIPPDSVLVCCIGSLGKVGYLGVEAATNQQINSLVFDSSRVVARYGYHYCKTLKPLLVHMAPLTTVPIVNKTRFESIKIPLPPLKEQKRIADILDKADALREKRKQSIAKLDELLQSVFLDMFGDPVTNPKGWDNCKFGDVGTLDRGKSKHRPRNDPMLLGGDYPLVQTGDVANSGGYIDHYTQTYSEAGLRQSRMWSSGTLCITIAANIAKTGILTFDACFPDSVVGFMPNGKTTVEYVQQWLSFLQETIERTAPESAQKNINLKILKALEIPIPPVSEQKRFSRIVCRIRKQRGDAENCASLFDALFSSLQQKAFKGEL